MHTASFVHSTFMSLQWSPGFKLRVANEASIWAGLNVSSFNVSLNVAFVSVVFFTEATTPIFDPRLHQTAGLLFNVLCHSLLLHKDWKCCWVKCLLGTAIFIRTVRTVHHNSSRSMITLHKQDPCWGILYFFSHYTWVCFLFVVVHSMTRGSDFSTHITLKSHVHVVGLNVPCHIIPPLVGVITKGTFEKPPT